MLRFSIFGAGQMGDVHARMIAENPNGKVHSVVDANAARRLADEYGAVVTPDPEAALADVEVDAVVITTPSAYHPELVIASARAGKAIFCQKPLAEDSATARAAVKAVQEAGVLSYVGFMKRFWPGLRAVEERARSGEIGKIEMVFVKELRDSHSPAPLRGP